jgi:hypothetical protein
MQFWEKSGEKITFSGFQELVNLVWPGRVAQVVE